MAAEWMASREPLERQCPAATESVIPNRICGKAGTGRLKPAGRTEKAVKQR